MAHYFVFILLSCGLILTPGADTVLITKNTLAHGKKAGLCTMAGTLSGISIYILSAVFGLSAIIAASPILFTLMKFAGGCYLLYLGIVALKEAAFRKKRFSMSKENVITARASFYRQGTLTNVFNPKIAVFFVTFLPQFVPANAENTLFKLIGLGASFIFLALVWIVIYIQLVHVLKHWLEKPLTRRIINSLSGAAFLGFGLKLVLEKR